eukprot:UN27229
MELCMPLFSEFQSPHDLQMAFSHRHTHDISQTISFRILFQSCGTLHHFLDSYNILGTAYHYLLFVFNDHIHVAAFIGARCFSGIP